MSTSGTVAFIVIAFNEEKTIVACINSILSQDYGSKHSIIIVNDASTDNTGEIVEKLVSNNSNLKLVTNKTNMGRGFSRQIGVRNADADFIAFVDADIQLPTFWLKECISKLKEFDACGGIAVPDGDVQYVYTKYNLRPKVKKHTAEISGGNGLFKKKVFSKVNFNEKMKDGEDVDFVWKLKTQNFKLCCIDTLHVKHKENKSYIQSIKWLYDSGFGANRLLWRFGHFRLPDVSFLIFLVLFILSLYTLYSFNTYLGLLLLTLYIWFVSTAHLLKSFYIDKVITFFVASIANASLIGAYFVGRFIGLITLQK